MVDRQFHVPRGARWRACPSSEGDRREPSECERGAEATREQRALRAILREVLASGASEGSSERALTVDEKRNEREAERSEASRDSNGSVATRESTASEHRSRLGWYVALVWVD